MYLQCVNTCLAIELLDLLVFVFIYFYFMCTCILLAYMYIYHVYTCVLLEVRRGWIPVTRVMYESELPRAWVLGTKHRCSGRAVSTFNRYLSSSSCGLSVCDFLRSFWVSTLAILMYSRAMLWLFSFHPSRNLLSFIFLVIAILTGGDIALYFKLASPQLLVALGSLPYKVHQMYVICQEMSTRFIVFNWVVLWGPLFTFALELIFVFSSYSEYQPHPDYKEYSFRYFCFALL